MSEQPATGSRPHESGTPEPLSWSQRRFFLMLGAPALGMAMVVTVVSTYLPVLVAEASGPILVGVLIGGEGFFGLFMPALVGAWSDRRSRRVGDRRPLLAGFAVAVTLAITAVGVLAGAGAGSFSIYVGVLVVLYAGYYSFLAPYWSVYPALVPDQHSGRSRSAEGSMRVTGVGLALVGGGLLLDVWPGLPFLAAAVVVPVTVGVLLLALRSRRDVPVSGSRARRSKEPLAALLRDSGIRRICLSEALWNFALSSLRAFVVLYFIVGLDRSSSFVATVIFPLVAVGIGVAAPASGWAADRWGHVRVLLVAGTAYAVGMALPTFFQAPWVIALIPVVAAGAATVMTVPFAVLMRLLSDHDHGTASGLFGFSRGVGQTLGPVVTGVVIVASSDLLDGTEGYASMWLVCSVALLASLPLLWGLRRDERV